MLVLAALGLALGLGLGLLGLPLCSVGWGAAGCLVVGGAVGALCCL